MTNVFCSTQSCFTFTFTCFDTKKAPDIRTSGTQPDKIEIARLWNMTTHVAKLLGRVDGGFIKKHVSICSSITNSIQLEPQTKSSPNGIWNFRSTLNVLHHTLTALIVEWKDTATRIRFWWWATCVQMSNRQNRKWGRHMQLLSDGF